MIDDSQNNQVTNRRPMDPTKDAGDFIGDTTGMTGVTTGSAQAGSSTPNDTQKDQNKDHLPGGITSGQPQNISTNTVTPDTEDDDAYKKRVLQGMSSTVAQANEDIAGEDDTPTSRTFQMPQMNNQSSDDTFINTTQAPNVQPYNQGEQSVSGTTPDPDSDDDTLANAQAMGQQLGEDPEHPQELDIARDVDAAEQNIVHD